MDQSEFLTYVDIRLQKIHRIHHRKIKLVVVNELYEYVIQNKWFVKKHTKFYKTIRYKLQEIKTDLDTANNKKELYDIFDVDKYIKIFDTGLVIHFCSPYYRKTNIYILFVGLEWGK